MDSVRLIDDSILSVSNDFFSFQVPLDDIIKVSTFNKLNKVVVFTKSDTYYIKVGAGGLTRDLLLHIVAWCNRLNNLEGKDD